MVLKIFVDSDVVISSLLSQKGAAFLLLNQTDELDLFISTVSFQELMKVAKRLNLEQTKLKNLIDTRLSLVQLQDSGEQIKTTFADYVLDQDDAHIVAGAKEAKAQFLISYNTKHFKADKLRDEFKIILATPATFLQYLRSV